MAAPCEFGNWQSAIDSILETVEQSNDFQTFNHLKSNEDRVTFIFKTRLLRHVEWLPLYFNASKKWHGKSTEVAQVWKNKGNKFFQQKKYTEAVDAYSQSCLHAPPEKGNDLALSFGNRSAALFHLGHYQDCLTDIKRSRENKFPSASLHKLLARSVSAHIKLGEKRNAEESYGILQEFVNSEDFSLKNKKKDDFLQDMEDLQKQIKEMPSSPKLIQEEKAMPAVCFGVNKVVSQATDGITLTVTPEKGRHLLANRDIPKGSSIIVERPFAAVLLPDHYETHCHYCFSSLPLTHIGCQRCTAVRFCNEVCHEKAWTSYHGIECVYLDLFHSVGIAHLGLRIILCAGLDFLMDFVQNQDNFRQSDDMSSKGINAEGRYDRSYLTVYDLMTHKENTESQDMLQYSLTAALLLTTLIHAGFFKEMDAAGDKEVEKNSLMQYALGIQKLKDEREHLPQAMHHIGGLLLRHILQLVCNAHAITSLQAVSDDHDTSLGNTHDTEQVRIATAIYPTASLMNHSCDPTIVSSFIGDVLVVKTVKDVNKGDEIYNCYGPHYCRMNIEERQEVLLSQYHFKCDCVPCDSGDKAHERFGAFKCPRCAGVLTDQTCQECGHFVNDETLARLHLRAEKAQKMFSDGIKLMNSQDFEGAISILENCLKQRRKFLYEDHTDLAFVEDAIARCFASIDDYSSSADHLFISVKFAEKKFGDKSTEFAHELQKLAEVLFNAERFTECLTVANQCLKLFETQYSPGHEAIKEITDLYNATQLALTPMMQANSKI